VLHAGATDVALFTIDSFTLAITIGLCSRLLHRAALALGAGSDTLAVVSAFAVPATVLAFALIAAIRRVVRVVSLLISHVSSLSLLGALSRRHLLTPH
jgi:hypothetical protein